MFLREKLSKHFKTTGVNSIDYRLPGWAVQVSLPGQFAEEGHPEQSQQDLGQEFMIFCVSACCKNVLRVC